ncbi:WYL domain-containing protein [Paenibacillus sp. MMS20-IR301]|uniref:helix-turn-helix transcriptional regulator n=1 Tax=Paenibacillus sp. MMS20-IR301 TaxID=2895946 RepID=UPI0028ECFC89|nr:WYL domain-containing protein [Paenibacillus sp. MMS20-IR301]WNS41539.1 WYL domain-containing protein [Paenibacillus sp. MMS20-IR301]
MNLDFNGNKGFRLLNMHELLNRGELIKKAELAERYGVTEKTIQRDIDELRVYLADTRFAEGEVSIKYDRIRSGYYLVRMEREWITNEEVLAICKILLESRAFCKEELDTLVVKLLAQVTSNDRKQVENMIRNEQFYYVPLRHGKKLLAAIWELSQYITHHEVIRISYVRQDGVERAHEVKPVAIMFSEYYFYLIAFMADDRHGFPTVFRIDRIESLQGTGIKFKVPYKDKFNDGEFRKRVQFMYSGELQRVKFKFSGTSIEAVLDKLPTAQILSENEGVYVISVETYGNGVDMWIRGQGEKVEVL